MERAWSTRTHEHVRQACEEGSDMIEKLAKQSAQVYSVAHAFPTFAGEVPLTEYGTHEGVPNRLYFVPHAKALVFFRSVKAGLLLGVEQGQGFVIARVGGATSNRWSAPAFVRVTGVGFGLVAGMDRAETLVGVMSNRALDALINSKGKFTMSSNWNFEITPLESDKTGGANPSWIFNADFTSTSISRGIMADVAVQGTLISFDTYWIDHCYGSGTTPAQILRGEIEPPPELSVMTNKLMTCCSPQLAGINQPLRPSMFGPTEGGAATATTEGATTTTTVPTTTATTVPTTPMAPERAAA